MILRVSIFFGLICSLVSKISACTYEELQCNSGECLPASFFCDNENDCSDNSDENNCIVCPSGFGFQCSDMQMCIASKYRCDGVIDCDDWSDEEGCDFTEDCIQDDSDENNCTCADDQFQCNNTRCTEARYFCDGEKDCADDSDENNCKVCPTGFGFQCKNNQQCISSIWPCDGVIDCRDGSDEDLELCGHKNCTADEFKCTDSGFCIKPSKVCSSYSDCPDGSDELCAVCPSGFGFLCKDQEKCVSSMFRCDGRPHCGDHSDETDCDCYPGEAGVDYRGNASTTTWADVRCMDWERVDPALFTIGDYPDAGLDQNFCRNPNPDNRKSPWCFVEPTDGHVLPWAYCNLSECTVLTTPTPTTPDTNKVCQSNDWEFQCSDGLCLAPWMVCDGYRDHCMDKGDEDVDLCGPTKCTSETFVCGDGLCIPGRWRCDFHVDCQDMTDEEGCVHTTPAPTTPDPRNPCTAEEFWCRDFEGTRHNPCLSPDQVCDGTIQCRDGSDEMHCGTCPGNFVQCTNSTKCVYRNDVCDGVEDNCGDNSDEAESLCDPCTDDEFWCKYLVNRDEEYNPNICIPASHVCDGTVHCENFRDETKCGEHNCTADQFQCGGTKEGLCIDEKFLCDFDHHCPDSSDEYHSTCMERNCTADQFQCGGVKQGLCIDGDRICGKYYFECPDGSDEWPSTCEICPPGLGFQCSDMQQCIPSYQKCNGMENCKDESDEAVELCGVANCTAEQFQCGLFCIEPWQVCDDYNDCPDDTDEYHDGIPCVWCPPGFGFQCRDMQKCITTKRQCDGVDDCDDGSDEEGCATTTEATTTEATTTEATTTEATTTEATTTEATTTEATTTEATTTEATTTDDPLGQLEERMEREFEGNATFDDQWLSQTVDAPPGVDGEQMKEDLLREDICVGEDMASLNVFTDNPWRTLMVRPSCPRDQHYGCASEHTPLPCVRIYVEGAMRTCCPVYPANIINNAAHCNCCKCGIMSDFGVQVGTCARRYRYSRVTSYCHGPESPSQTGSSAPLTWAVVRHFMNVPTSCYCRAER